MNKENLIRRLKSTNALVLGIFILLSIVFTWPLLINFGNMVIGPFIADNLEYVWKLWWVEHSIIDLGQSPNLFPDAYAPYGYLLTYGETTPLHTYLGIPLTATLGPVITYNLFILVSFVLSGYFTYLFVKELTGSKPAGLMAGVVFAFSPYRMARAAGHLPLIDTQWIPIFMLFLGRFARHSKPKDAALTGIFFAASALSSWYYGLMLAILTPFYFFALTKGSWQTENLKKRIRGGIVFALVGLLLILPFFMPYIQTLQSGNSQVSLDETVFWSANLNDYFTPNPRHFLWGSWVQNNLNPYPYEDGIPFEFILGWGIISSVLALYGWRRGRNLAGKGWGWWITIAFILSLGPALKVFNTVVTLPAPEFIANGFNGILNWLGQHSFAHESFSFGSDSSVAIPLPGLLLRWFVPGAAGMRAWGRFAIFATLGIATLAGAGTAAFLKDEVEIKPTQYPRFRRWAVTALMAGLVLFEFYIGPQKLIATEPRPVDRWLAAYPEQVIIIQLPVQVALSGPQMYYTMHHGQRIASGYGTYFPILFEDNYPELEEFPSDQALDTLSNWGRDVSPNDYGVTLILIDESHVPADDPLWSAIKAQDRLQLETILDGVHVYVILH